MMAGGYPPACTCDFSRASDAQLVAELRHMLQGEVMTYPNPVEKEIEKRNRPFMEGSDALFVFKSRVGRTSSAFDSEVLSKLKRPLQLKHLYLYPVPGWSEADPVFDYVLFAEQLQNRLPNLESLHLQHMKGKNFCLKGLAKLQELFLTDPQLQDSHWNLDLPELRRLSMSNHVPPVDKFAQSLLQCPKIEIFYAHKYWNDHPLPELFLPSCRRFTFRRGDCTRQLKLYLPQVEELILDANYELESLVFLKQGHPRHAAWNVAPSGPQSKFILSCVNANLGKKVKQTLIQSGRLLNTLADAFGPEDDEFGQGPMFGMDAFWKHARPGLFPDCNGPGEDDSDPPRAVPADQQSSRGAMAQGGQRSADQGPVGKAVWVAHLKSRPELVGRSGVIVQQFAAGRVGVRFDHDKTLELSVKMENLEFLPDGLDQVD